jgi:hypothetical protein
VNAVADSHVLLAFSSDEFSKSMREWSNAEFNAWIAGDMAQEAPHGIQHLKYYSRAFAIVYKPLLPTYSLNIFNPLDNSITMSFSLHLQLTK